MRAGAPRATLTTEATERLVAAAAAKARELEIRVHIAVMDSSAQLVGWLSFEGAPRIAAQTARDKAFTAVSTGMSTLAWKRYVESIPADEQRIIAGIDGYIAADGGHPILEGGLLLGAIGVSGADQQRDAAVALAAIEALGL
ncbi:MAG TPA: heme-binding protein [Myxococcota bacterium]|nr:heme-binding protein [Myxococcota bacterium]